MLPREARSGYTPDQAFDRLRQLGGYVALQLGVDLPGVVLAGPRNDLGVGGALHQWTEQISNHGLVQGARYPNGHTVVGPWVAPGAGDRSIAVGAAICRCPAGPVGRRLAFGNHAIGWFAAPFGRRPGGVCGYDRQRWWWQQIVDLVVEPGWVEGRSPGGHEVTPTAGSGGAILRARRRWLQDWATVRQISNRSGYPRRDLQTPPPVRAPPCPNHHRGRRRPRTR